MPLRAPASMDMLQTVMRSSSDIARIVEPAYSMAWPTPPPAPIVAMIARITSLAATPAPSRPSMVTRMLLGLRCHRVWVASTCSTSLEPMPNASAPERAVRGGVAVAAHQQHPGQRQPLLRPDHVHDAAPDVTLTEMHDPLLGRVGAERLHHPADLGIGRRRPR